MRRARAVLPPLFRLSFRVRYACLPLLDYLSIFVSFASSRLPCLVCRELELGESCVGFGWEGGGLIGRRGENFSWLRRRLTWLVVASHELELAVGTCRQLELEEERDGLSYDHPFDTSSTFDTFDTFAFESIASDVNQVYQRQRQLRITFKVVKPKPRFKPRFRCVFGSYQYQWTWFF